MEAQMDGLNFSPRNMQQLINNTLKDATSVVLVTTGGDALPVKAPLELGTEAMAFKSDKGTVIVPYTAVQRIVVE
jgi:hypothetical protein